jgi:hypothetical protein
VAQGRLADGPVDVAVEDDAEVSGVTEVPIAS